MHGCHDCQELMLEHLYDLLDEAQQQSFQVHLTGCSDCQAALQKVRGQQALIAAAARMQVGGAAFVPPAPDAAPQPVSAPPAAVAPQPFRTVLLPVRPRLGKPVKWQPWALAAGVLLALAGVGVPAYQARREFADSERILQNREAVVAGARKQIDETKDQLNRAVAERDRRIEEIRHTMKSRELRLVVSGPQTVQPGAPADFQVRAFDLNGQPAKADLYARFTDEAPSFDTPASRSRAPDSKPVSNTSAGTSKLAVAAVANGVYRVTLPPNMRLQPGRAIDMVVEARMKGAQADKAPVTLKGKVQLTSPSYLTHLATDKPMYQPGETVHYRSLTVDRLTLAPATESFRFQYTLTTPTGAERSLLQGGNSLVRVDARDHASDVVGPDGKSIKGVGAGEFLLEPDIAGGEYTLTVREELKRFPPVQRKFLVNRYQKPRLDKKLDFNRSSYGPGDEVQARVTALRADGGPVKDRPVEITVNIDDKLYDAAGKPTGMLISKQTDDHGQVLVRFKLPATIERGQASLSIKFNDGTVVETIVRTIPIVLKKLQVEFFPEGGDLVAGAVNRVYFQARTPLDKPAQLRGTLMDGDTPLPITVATLHDDKEPGVNQGLGVFSFTPAAGRKYSLRIDTPTGIAERKELPATRDGDVVLTIPRGVFAPNEPIRVLIHSRKPKTLMVGAYCRGQLLDTAQLECRGGLTPEEVVLRPTSGAGGVCRVTVFEELLTGRDQRALKPVAERLVYRHPQQRVHVAVTADQRRYVPGQKVNLSLLATDENDKPKPAIVLLGIVDKSVLTMADEKTARTMPTHFLLTTEVRRAEDLEYADFLVGKHPLAPQVLDLLLGTQGWRRFAEQNPVQFRDRLHKEAEILPGNERQRQEEEGERLMVMIGQSNSREIELDKSMIEQLKLDFNEYEESLKRKHTEATTALEGAYDDPAYATAVVRLNGIKFLLQGAREVAVPLLAALVALLLLLAVIRALQRPRLALSLGTVGAVCAVLLALVVREPIALPMHELIKSEREVAALTRPPSKIDAEELFEAENRTRELERSEALGVPGGGLGGGGARAPGPAEPGGFGGAFRFRPQMPNGAGKPGAMPGADKKGDAAGKAMAGQGLGRGGFGMNQLATKNNIDGERRAGANQPQAFFRKDGVDLPQAKEQKRELADGRKAFKALAEDKTPLGGLEAAKDMKQERPLDEAVQRRLRYANDLGFGLNKRRNNGKGARMLAREELPMVVREYAHVRPAGSSNALRSDFAETIYWHPVLVLPDGKANVSFDLCDSVTSFQVTAFAHTLDGRLGAATSTIESRLPFTLAPKVPVEVTSTDRIELAVGIANNTSEKRQVRLALTDNQGLELLQGDRDQRFDLAGDGRLRKLFRFRPTQTSGTAKVAFEATTAPFAADGIRETIRVVPDGFPVSGYSSDLLEKSVTHRIKLPERWIAGTLQCQVDIYPSTLADLQKGLEGLLREPNGCFEQSSTSNYPNVLILDYLRTSDKSNPELERRVREVLDRGYQRLTSFECMDNGANARRGYEWFGGAAPPHEALTAYGLLQFRDMSRVYDVDKAMLERTHGYLMKQRDGKGGFARNQRALDTFGRAPDHVTNAYIVWALTESGKDDVATELNALAEQAKTSDDPYFVSLVAISLTNRGRKSEATALLRTVANAQKDDGHLDAKQTSITSSGGRDLQIETTALAVLGWLKTDAPAFYKPINQAVKWIGQQRGGYGGFGSTQSTILALKALIAHAQANKRTPEAGVVRLYIGERKMAEQAFPAGVDRPITLKLSEPEKNLTPGMNTLRVEITGDKNVFPHTLSWMCRTDKPDSAAGCPVELTTTLAKTELAEGDTVRLKVKVKNVSGSNQGMTVAIVGLPAGLIVPEDLKQLKEHCRVPADVKQPLLGAFEILGRELVLYWRDMAKDQQIEIPIDLIARVPGVYRGPASRGYLYYNADKKHWIEPLGVTIAIKP